MIGINIITIIRTRIVPHVRLSVNIHSSGTYLGSHTILIRLVLSIIHPGKPQISTLRLSITLLFEIRLEFRDKVYVSQKLEVIWV